MARHGPPAKRGTAEIMLRRSITLPLSVICAGLVVVLLLLAAPSAGTRVAAQDDQAYIYATQTAQAGQSNPYIPPAVTAVSTASATPGATPPSGQPTPRPGASPAIPTRSVPQFSPTVAPAPSPTVAPPTLESAPTPTPTPAPPTALTCESGEPLVVSGFGRPRAGFLVAFDGIAVAGGSVGPDGRFSLTLLVGDVASGAHTVIVTDRDSRGLLLKLTCAATRTPTPVPTRFP
jgi:hypothetical protein